MVKQKELRRRKKTMVTSDRCRVSRVQILGNMVFVENREKHSWDKNPRRTEKDKSKLRYQSTGEQKDSGPARRTSRQHP